jgi:hypothetical protein
MFDVKTTSEMVRLICVYGCEKMFDFVLENTYYDITKDIYPIIIACAYDKINYIDKLVNKKFPIHQNAGHQASKNGNIEIIKKLNKLKATLNKDCLIYAGKHNKMECYNYLKTLHLTNPSEKNWFHELTKRNNYSDSIIYSNKLNEIFNKYAKNRIPYKLEDVEKFEKLNNITLPYDFKTYLTKYSRCIYWGSSYCYFEIYDVKIHDLFELCNIKVDDDKDYVYIEILTNFDYNYYDEISSKYKYCKIPKKIYNKHFSDKNIFHILYYGLQDYISSGKADDKMTRIKKIDKDDEHNVYWYSFDCKNKKLVRDYSDKILKDIHGTSEIEYRKIFNRGKKLHLVSNGCMSCYLILDGFFKDKIIFTECYYHGKQTGSTIMNSFTDMAIMFNVEEEYWK